MIIPNYQEEKRLAAAEPRACEMATVAGLGENGLSLRFDGSMTDSNKQYKRLESYAAPATGDRVYIQKISGTYIVLGKVV